MFPSSGSSGDWSDDSGYDGGPADYAPQWTSAPSSAASYDSDSSNDGFDNGAGGGFDPTVALRGLMDRVRLPMDDFPADSFGAGAPGDLPPRSRSTFDDLYDAPSQRPDGFHRSLEAPASLYLPQPSFMSDGAGRPQPDYFLDPVAAELAAAHPHDEATPRANGGWKGKGRASAPGWQDFEPSIDAIYAAPSFMPHDRHGFADRAQYPAHHGNGFDDPQAGFDQPQRHRRSSEHGPPAQLQHDALAEVRHRIATSALILQLDQLRQRQDMQDRERLRQWEERLRSVHTTVQS